jgi:hypothetical protein
VVVQCTLERLPPAFGVDLFVGQLFGKPAEEVVQQGVVRTVDVVGLVAHAANLP